MHGKGLIIRVLGGLALLAAAVWGILILIERVSKSALPPEQLLAYVMISSPRSGDTGRVGSPQVVQVIVNGVTETQAIELWIDGEWLGEYERLDADPPLQAATFDWMPTQPGLHALVARAVDAQQHTSTSAPVVVSILENEALSGLPDSEYTEPAVYPPASQVSPPASPPGGGGGIAPGETWHASPGVWFTNLTANQPPKAPELAGSSAGCEVTLNLHDQSDNEAGFRIYRISPQTPDWVEAATLSPQPGDDAWFQFSEVLPAGWAMYYAAAFNGEGELASNIVTLNVTADPCDAPPKLEQGLYLDLVDLSVDPPLDKFYCYISIGGKTWLRSPSGDWGVDSFFDVGYEIGQQTFPLLQNPMVTIDFGKDGGKPPTIDLKANCWGWKGDKLKHVGDFAGKLDLNDPETIQINADAISGKIMPHWGTVETPVQFLSLDEHFLFDVLPTDLELIYPEPTLAQLPSITAWVTDDPQQCMQHLPSYMSSDLKAKDCAPLPGFNKGPGGANPQKYLVWIVMDDICAAGYNEDCVPFSWLVDFAHARGGNVGFLLDLGGGWGQEISNSVTEWRIDPGLGGCSNGQRAFKVQIWTEIPGSFLGYYGPSSNAWTIPCPEPLPYTNGLALEITFDQLQLSNVDDGDISDPQDVEVYGAIGGAFQSGSMITQSSLTLCYGPESIKNYDCLVSLTNGQYFFEGFDLCLRKEDESRYACDDGPFTLSNNLVTVSPIADSGLRIWVSLWDYDSLYDDRVCWTSITIPPRDMMEWAAMDHEPFTISADHDNADCQVTGFISAVKK